MFKEYLQHIKEIRDLLILSQLLDLDLVKARVTVEISEGTKLFYVNDVLLLKEVNDKFEDTRFYCAIL